MARLGQLGVAIGALGAMLTLMGLFPGVTGVAPTGGIGVVQLFAVMIGFALLIMGALLYIKFTFYATKPSTLMQQIGVRLAWTGLLLSAMAGLADILGFGSHLRTETTDIHMGPWQAVGIVGCFILASIGVVIYALAGEPEIPDEED